MWNMHTLEIWSMESILECDFPIPLSPHGRVVNSLCYCEISWWFKFKSLNWQLYFIVLDIGLDWIVQRKRVKIKGRIYPINCSSWYSMHTKYAVFIEPVLSQHFHGECSVYGPLPLIIRLCLLKCPEMVCYVLYYLLSFSWQANQLLQELTLAMLNMDWLKVNDYKSICLLPW